MKKILGVCIIVLLSGNILSQKISGDPIIKGDLLVQINDKTDAAIFKKNVVDLGNGFIVEKCISERMRAWLVHYDVNQLSHQEAHNQIENLPFVSLVEDNVTVTLRETIPNDDIFSNQWHHKNTGQSGGVPGADIQSYDAWDITTGGTTATNDEIVVCVIESANVMGHPDLEANHWVNEYETPNNGVDDDGNGYVDDYNGWNVSSNNDNLGTGSHGTQVAGMIGAKGNNTIGLVGANWDVKIMVVADQNVTSSASVIEAYSYPLKLRTDYNNSNGEKGAFVVATNASWGIDNANPNSYQLWCNFYDTLGVEGILNCGATSNNNTNVDVQGDMPTGCSSPYMIGVGRSDDSDNRAGGYGLTTIELVAPGVNVWSTAQTGYTSTTGTSFSSPLTAGVIGLMYAIPCQSFMDTVKLNPQRGADIVRKALLDGVDKKPQLENFYITGGRLNAFNALDTLMKMTCVPCDIKNISLEAMPCASTEDIVYTLNGSAELVYPPLSGQLEITHSDGPSVTLQSPFDSIINFELQNVPANGESYSINFSFTADSTCTAQIDSVNIDGCSSELSTAFSPNGDNINDFWEINKIESFEDNVVTIFNRWGVKVKEIQGYNNEDVSWDGTNMSGGKLPSGTYFYILESSNNDPVKGWIEIIK